MLCVYICRARQDNGNLLLNTPENRGEQLNQTQAVAAGSGSRMRLGSTAYNHIFTQQRLGSPQCPSLIQQALLIHRIGSTRVGVLHKYGDLESERGRRPRPPVMENS